MQDAEMTREPLTSRPEDVLRQARGENFPVSPWFLPRDTRAHLTAIYGFARLVDDTGDEARGDRLALLDGLARDVDRLYATGDAAHPLVRGLGPTVERYGLPADPLHALIEANRWDQVVTRYRTCDDLLAYCRLSANPVGYLVLAVFGAATPERLEQSGRICTGLQLVEHWQDVAEDHDAGRVYLPQADLRRFGVGEHVIADRRPTPAFRRLMAYEVEVAAALLRDGEPLIASLSGTARLAVGAYAAGGHAALGAIRRARYDVLRHAPRPSPARTAAWLLRVLLTGGRP